MQKDSRNLWSKLMSTTTLAQELAAPYALSPAQIDQYQTQGFIKLKNVLSPEVIDYYGSEITRQVFLLNQQKDPIEHRSTYGKAFLQIGNLWTKSDIVKEFVLSRRLGRIAAELMRVAGTRIWHDQALYKEASGGITPWHADQYYWPLSNSNTITAWIPLQATPMNMGPLAFSVGSQKYTGGRNMAISDESEQRISKMLLEQQLPQVNEPFDLGEVSFHSGWTYHHAGPNTSNQPRKVMTIIYMEDGIRLIAPQNKAHQSDWDTWAPGCKVGEPVATHLNPVVYRKD
jgi:ectoine hydroxylase-related dioxygenase (phytanoyl-CoA dioxygenase family)